MRLAAVEETAEVTPGVVSVGEQPMENQLADVVEETGAEEAVEGHDTEQVTSGQEVVPESWEDHVGEEPIENPAVVENMSAENMEAWYSPPPLIRNVAGIRPVTEHGVLLDHNTENIVKYTPRSHKRL